MIDDSGGFEALQRYYLVITLNMDLWGANYRAFETAQSYSRFDRHELRKQLHSVAFDSIMGDALAMDSLRKLQPLQFRVDKKYYISVIRRPHNGDGKE